MRHPLFGDFDFLFGEEEPDPNGQVYVQFEDERGSEEQTETDVKNLEGRTRMSLQQLKEQILGTVSSYFEILRKFWNFKKGILYVSFKSPLKSDFCGKIEEKWKILLFSKKLFVTAIDMYWNLKKKRKKISRGFKAHKSKRTWQSHERW